MSALPSAACLAKALGGHKHGASWMAKCPAHDDNSPSLSIRDGADGPLVHCHAGCDQKAVIAALRAKKLWPPPPESDEKRNGRKGEATEADRLDWAKKNWGQAVDGRGTLAARYLAGRGVVVPDDCWGRVLRFHRGCKFGNYGKHPALICRFSDPRTGAFRGVQRIALTADGNSVRDEHGERLKMMLGVISDAVCMLSASEEVEEGVGIAEGVETSLAVLARWQPIWAVGSATFLAKFGPIPGIETITVFGDHDARSHAGQFAAANCAALWRKANLEATVYMPALPGDWLDEATR